MSISVNLKVPYQGLKNIHIDSQKHSHHTLTGKREDDGSLHPCPPTADTIRGVPYS